MLIVALVLAVIGLAALVTAVVSSNEIVAWVCIGASALGVVLLVVDAIRERQRRSASAPTAAAVAETATAEAGAETASETTELDQTATLDQVGEADETGPVSEQQAEIAEIETGDEAPAPDSDSPDDTPEIVAEDHPDEIVHDEPEFDTYSDDEPEYPAAADESALHTVDESDLTGGEARER